MCLLPVRPEEGWFPVHSADERTDLFPAPGPLTVKDPADVVGADELSGSHREAERGGTGRALVWVSQHAATRVHHVAEAVVATTQNETMPPHLQEHLVAAVAHWCGRRAE